MKTRTITGLVALLVLLPIVWYGSWPLVLGTAAMGVIGVSEMFAMKKKNFWSLTGILTSLATVMIIVPTTYLSFLPQGIDITTVFFLFAMTLLVMTVLSKNDFTFDDAGVFLLAAIYIGTGFHYFLQTALFSFRMVLFVLLLIWATDIGAYLVGKQFGKTKLAPVISPNKTIEGSLGGMVLSVICGMLFIQWYNPLNLSIPMVILLAVLTSIVGQLGDLTESAYKRYFGVKDSGKILPGHGGILDRFDSMLFVMPLFQLVLAIFNIN
ncbi:MAG TPA: phosphatidate cytidylyltransferase [Candidatus Jeotgalibaca merdavium]|uniref:Phosphatidate cytidylyltransferase n=2 Tax=Jeotgalibaca TaxID=1470540 RepID=A0A6G7KCG2_9LACT|nr:phosphatidate cytidylyltransferase [Jeotgalibaca arthritidis]QII82945.1 phosphatidate cytidylyltransferase [Jeotgalibaca arthritidis]HJA90266.1 phosphatidate cytidylyltransferase [Candidatus Jeotgalibaca merdavium]